MVNKIPMPLTLQSEIPVGRNDCEVSVDGKNVRLTNLNKVFWPEQGYTKRDLLQYYLDVAEALLPHLADRAMVMKRYPNGIDGDFFFMKRTPSHRPDWLETCSIEHASGNIIDFPVVQDRASLLWVINLGCIDLNQWYARCDDINRPDYLHFDLDPTEGTDFAKVREAALTVHQALAGLKIESLVKTTGSRGLHVYIPIERGPVQKQVWTFAKRFAQSLQQLKPDVLTAEYRIAKRPPNRVLVDYNQNAWGRTLASVYSLRPRRRAPVSTPVTWEEVKSGIEIEDFTMENVPVRVRRKGDLWKSLVRSKKRMRLEQYL
jgi:bifunctional non-homologous end joining protein LigD